MRHGRRRFGIEIACAVAAAAFVAPLRAEAQATAPSGFASAGGTAAPPTSGTAIPFWLAPPLPSAVIQGGTIPAGWQPRAVPYQGIGPDGRMVTQYYAPTYVFTYQVGPPVLAVQGVNRRQTWQTPTTGGGQATGWNYATRGAPPVPAGLPPPTVARYAPAPYQFPADSRALAGTPIVPPAGSAVPPANGWAAAPPPSQPPALAAPPAAWMPSNEQVAPGMAPQPQSSAGWAAVAPPVAAGIASAATATASPQPAPTAALAPPPAPPMVPTPAASAAQPDPAPRAANSHLWRVVGVHDGDTVTCLDEANQQRKIRLAEIDAPEIGQDFGKVSREALAALVFGRTVEVVDDGRDRYGRWIGHLDVDGIDVNRQMVATGNAWHYAAYSQDPSLAALQAQAQAQRIGLWSQPDPTPPWDFRTSGGTKSPRRRVRRRAAGRPSRP